MSKFSREPSKNLLMAPAAIAQAAIGVLVFSITENNTEE
jgi:hypothetical protein